MYTTVRLGALSTELFSRVEYRLSDFFYHSSATWTISSNRGTIDEVAYSRGFLFFSLHIEKTVVRRKVDSTHAQPYTSTLNALSSHEKRFRPDGQKYKKAREWQTGVVNAQWLTDLLCGQMNALHQTENPKYQQYSLSNPFRLDYSLVPHLMGIVNMSDYVVLLWRISVLSYLLFASLVNSILWLH